MPKIFKIIFESLISLPFIDCSIKSGTETIIAQKKAITAIKKTPSAAVVIFLNILIFKDI